MTLTQISILAGLALFFAGGWVFLNFLINEEIENPDGHARVTGHCGDTMELQFKTEDGRVTAASHLCNGCSISTQCIQSTALMLIDKSIEEIQKINVTHIMDEVGKLPESHEHCALLAETTLHKAIEDYQQKLKKSKAQRRYETLS